MSEYEVVAEYSKNIKELIQSGRYEKYIIEMMNLSKIVFPHTYSHIDKQSDGECDIVDDKTGEQYDAKLPFNKKIGRMIGSNNSDYLEWTKAMLNFSNEYSERFSKGRRIEDVEGIQLYNVMKRRLQDVKADEKAIFFFPFPVVLSSGSVFEQFSLDALGTVYEALKQRGYVKNDIFCIYPGMDKGYMILRNLRTLQREYFKYEKLNQFFTYDMQRLF